MIDYLIIKNHKTASKLGLINNHVSSLSIEEFVNEEKIRKWIKLLLLYCAVAPGHGFGPYREKVILNSLSP